MVVINKRVELDSKNQPVTIYKVKVHQSYIVEDTDKDPVTSKNFITWKETDIGRFIIKNAKNISFRSAIDFSLMEYMVFVITAELEEKHLCEFYLKWGYDGNN